MGHGRGARFQQNGAVAVQLTDALLDSLPASPAHRDAPNPWACPDVAFARDHDLRSSGGQSRAGSQRGGVGGARAEWNEDGKCSGHGHVVPHGPTSRTPKLPSRIDRFHAAGHSRSPAATGAATRSQGVRLDLSSGASGVDLRAIWHLAVRRRWVILATAVTLFSAVALHTLRQPRVYGRPPRS